MFKKMSLMLALLMVSGVAAAQERSYVKTDGTFDLVCSESGGDFSQQYNEFTLTNLMDENTPIDIFGPSFQQALTSLDGTLVYDIKVKQIPFLGADVVLLDQPIQGCEFAPMSVTQKEMGKIEIYFECVADGAAGYGYVNVDMETAEMSGTFSFPEGKSDLIYPIAEDTEMNVNCSFGF